MSTKTRCDRGGAHEWAASGGCSENPGCFDSGNGGLIFKERCAKCGAIRRCGEDYTGERPGNDFDWRYTWPNSQEESHGN
jgi:hypothetical protein